MPVQTYTLDLDNPKRLDISYKMFWRGATVYLDGKEVGTAPGRPELFEGPGVQTARRLGAQAAARPEPHGLRAAHPAERAADTRFSESSRHNGQDGLLDAFFDRTLGILFGGVSLGLHVDMLGEMGITTYSIGLGVVFILLGFMVRRHSLPALYAGIALYALDTILGLVCGAERRHPGDFQHPVSRPNLHAAGARGGRAAHAEGAEIHFGIVPNSRPIGILRPSLNPTHIRER